MLFDANDPHWLRRPVKAVHDLTFAKLGDTSLLHSRKPSATPSINFDALAQLNEDRLKRLDELDGGTNRRMARQESDIILSFLKKVRTLSMSCVLLYPQFVWVGRRKSENRRTGIVSAKRARYPDQLQYTIGLLHM